MLLAPKPLPADNSAKMPRKLAASIALIVFALCLVVGGLQAGNTFTTTVLRALSAMVATFVVGLVVGSMADRMIRENLLEVEKKLKESPANQAPKDR